MLRGHRTSFLNLFESNTPTEIVIAPVERRGRSEVLLSKRNELLIHRYYYYIKIAGKQYLTTLSILGNEMFLTQRTIIDAIAKHNELLRELNATKPAPKYFKEKFGFMVWN